MCRSLLQSFKREQNSFLQATWPGVSLDCPYWSTEVDQPKDQLLMVASKVRAPWLCQPAEGAQTETGRSFSNSFTRAALTVLVMEGHACTPACLIPINKIGYLETPLPTPKPALSLLMKR